MRSERGSRSNAPLSTSDNTDRCVSAGIPVSHWAIRGEADMSQWVHEQRRPDPRTVLQELHDPGVVQVPVADKRIPAQAGNPGRNKGPNT